MRELIRERFKEAVVRRTAPRWSPTRPSRAASHKAPRSSGASAGSLAAVAPAPKPPGARAEAPARGVTRGRIAADFGSRREHARPVARAIRSSRCW